MGRRSLQGARTRHSRAQPPERRAPRTVLHQGHAQDGHAAGASERARIASRDSAADDRGRGPDVGAVTRAGVSGRRIAFAALESARRARSAPV